VNACPHGHFPTADGKYIAIACTTDKMFDRLTRAMARPDLLDAFGEQGKRLQNSEKVIAEVTKWTSSMPRDQVIDICVEHDVPAGAINSVADIFNDPQFAARQNLTHMVEDDLGEIVVPSAFPRLSKTPPEIRSLGPELGSSNNQVYGQELGFSADELATLKEKGVI
jgi:crotonobetainyl-CoA:carnitine CoA-transferase CaiB-like acyl-CoA transferase